MDIVRAVAEMKTREKQKKMWRKISFVTKQRGNYVTRLGIPIGYKNASTQAIWDYLQNPKSKPTWYYVTDPAEIERRLLE